MKNLLFFRGLDIVTNKVTPAERQLAKHHMIDFLDPLLKSTVVDFRNQVNTHTVSEDKIRYPN